MRSHPFLPILFFFATSLGGSRPQAQSKPFQPKPGETVVELRIGQRGVVDILLHTKEAPKTCEHILGLIKKDFYRGQKFFRVLSSPKPYLVQTGDPASKDPLALGSNLGQGGSGETIDYENSGFKHIEGAVALATLNGDRNTGDSQFYILLDDYSALLDTSDTVFGQVVAGLDVVHKIEAGDKIEQVRVLPRA